MVPPRPVAGSHERGGLPESGAPGPISRSCPDPEAVATVVGDPLRLAAVRRMVPLYRPPSLTFDRLTRLASQLLDAPLALLTLVEADRQFFVSSHGLPEPLRSDRHTPIEYSICQFAVAVGRPLVVPDTSSALFLAGHPAVTEYRIGSYAGVPLVTPDGWAVGALCVMDFTVRDWSDDQMANLALLAGICMDEIRLAGLDRQAHMNRTWPRIR